MLGLEDRENVKENVKTNQVSVVSIICAALIVLFYLLMYVLILLFPAPPPHASPFYSTAAPFHWFLASAQFLLGPAALIMGIIAFKQIRKSMGTEKGKILALIGLIIGGIQTALLLLGMIAAIIFLPQSLRFAAGRSVSHATLPLTDNFSADCGWPRGENKTFAYGCEQGAYRLRLKKPGPVHIPRNLGLGVEAVSAEVDASVASGHGSEQPSAAVLGIGCLSDENHGYVTILKTDGAWAIMRLDREFIQLACTNEAGRVQGLGRTDRLRIVCVSGREDTTVVSFFVNGLKVSSAEDRHGYKSFNGFFLYADTWPGEVVFERFAAHKPAE